jgi:hypothetical protein
VQALQVKKYFYTALLITFVDGPLCPGFYYICIDMDGRTGGDVTRSPMAATRTLSGQDNLLPPKTPTSPKLTREMLPGAMQRRTSSGSRVGPATMSGFYYHANSEPLVFSSS